MRCALDGDAILFVGAGVSFLARREGDREVPDAAALTDLLLGQTPGTGSRHNLDRVAGAVIRKRGVDFVYDVIRDSFTVKTVSPVLKTIYARPWKRIYTTNYDDAVEIARAGEFPLSSITIDEDHSRAKPGSVIHLNGYVKRISPANIEQGLLLTDTSYAASRLTETGWLSFFEQDIRSSRAIIFVGYSLYDLDIDSTLLDAEVSRNKAFFFISPKADEIEVSTLERYGTVIPGGVQTLADQLDEVSKGYKPPAFYRSFTSLRELEPVPAVENSKASAQILFEQLVYGKLPEQQVLGDERVFSSQTYLVRRKQDIEAQEALRRGPWRDVVFVGEIASGKSASTLTLAAHLRGEGYRVYYAQHGESLIEDLRRLATNDEKLAVIFDGYSAFRDAIRDFVGRRRLEHRVILAERSAVHDLVGDFIDQAPHLGPVIEITLDRIAEPDVPAFEALTNFGGFWGDRAGASEAARERHIKNDLDASLYRLLLEIIKSEKVQQQIRDLLKPMQNNRRVSRLFCSAMIVNALRLEFSVSEWQYLFDRNTVREMFTKYSEQVRHFLWNDSDQIYTRNGLLSSHILHSSMDDDVIGQSMVDLYEIAERSMNEGWKWRTLAIELTKFSSIEPLFSQDSRAEHIFSYYDKIRVFGRTKDNPDYWLQLGIAATVFDDLPRGRLCFDNAYAREKAQRHPNLMKIDNYYSRFQMKEAVNERDPQKAFATFINANDRLVRQIFLDINRHYPFKTGRYFFDVAAKHYESWNAGQQKKFREATVKIRDKALEWKASNHDYNPDVALLIKETTKLLKMFDEAAEKGASHSG